MALPQVLKPCPWMKGILSQLADGTAKGLSRWYGEKHVDRCPKCRAALEALKNLTLRLRTLSGGEDKIQQDVWDKLEATPDTELL